MILTYIITIALALFTFIVGLFPNADSSVTTYINSQVSSVNGWFALINPYFPSGTAVTIIKIVLTIEVTMIALRIIAWIISNVSLGFFKTNV